MTRCVRCDKEFGLLGGYKIEKYHIKGITRYGIGKHLCHKCWSEAPIEYKEIRKKELEKKSIVLK